MTQEEIVNWANTHGMRSEIDFFVRDCGLMHSWKQTKDVGNMTTLLARSRCSGSMIAKMNIEFIDSIVIDKACYPGSRDYRDIEPCSITKFILPDDVFNTYTYIVGYANREVDDSVLLRLNYSMRKKYKRIGGCAGEADGVYSLRNIIVDFTGIALPSYAWGYEHACFTWLGIQYCYRLITGNNSKEDLLEARMADIIRKHVPDPTIYM